MKKFPKITACDRILFLSPHPDDESLAGGGLLQRAAGAGAQVVVVFASDGEKNPWPQRALERKWMIQSHDRARWGERRRREALAALRHLGIAPGSAIFLGFPDQGFNRALLHGDTSVLAALVEAIDAFSPTLLITPSFDDLHPDHNALAVMAGIALDRLPWKKSRCELLHYLVHSKRAKPHGTRVVLHLSAREVTRKREAIVCHETQMVLSRARFISYARAREIFFRPLDPQPGALSHRITSAEIARGALRLRVRKIGRTTGESKLLVALESLLEGEVRWCISLPANSRCVRIENLLSGTRGRRAVVRMRRTGMEVLLPIAALQPVDRIFVKLSQPTLFFDKQGWREVPSRKVPHFEKQGALPAAREARHDRMPTAA